MSIQSVGNQMDVQRAKAEKFVNASDNTINRLARRNYNKLYREENKKFDKRVVTTLNTLPLVAVASGLVAGKGKKGALLNGLTWGMALVAPSLVAKANNNFVKNNPKVANAERKHPIATLTANIAASVGAFMGLTSIADKVLANPKVAGAGKVVADRAGQALSAVKTASVGLMKKAKVPELVVATMMRIPKPVMDGAEAFAKNPIVKNVGGFAKNLGKGLAKNAPALLVFGTVGAIIGKGVSDARKFSGIKSEIKDAQFNTAKNLVNAYSAENAELKAENAKLAQAEPVQADAEEVE